jgi:hypothetical protein
MELSHAKTKWKLVPTKSRFSCLHKEIKIKGSKNKILIREENYITLDFIFIFQNFVTYPPHTPTGDLPQEELANFGQRVN